MNGLSPFVRSSAPYLLLLLAALGCGRSELPFVDHSRDSDAYARTIKTLVTSELPSAKKSNDPQDFVNVVLGELENYQHRPVGTNRAIYAQLLEQCKELRDMFEQSGDKAAANAKIDEIVALANTLPGEAHVDTGDG